jgi:Winged helix DNA-binding domain
VTERVLTLRELNRATLARQLLLERKALSVPRALERLAAVQAQWPTAAYVALWSRVHGFRREALARALERRQVVRSTLMRTTIHMVSARDYLALAALWRARRREEFERQGGDFAAGEATAHAALADGRRTYTELNRELGEIFSTRFGPLVPLVHPPPAGMWRHRGRTPLADAERWLGTPLGEPSPGARLLVERYLAGYGPASRSDLLRFSGLRVRDVAAAIDELEPWLRRFRDEEGRTLLDLRRLPLPAASTPAPPRFLGRWDNAHLGYERRARILPDDYAARQIGRAGDQVFLADGFVAGIWIVERATTAAMLVLEPLTPLPRAVRRAVEDEAAALLRWHEPYADVHRVRWS